jgi:hypothetical protein
VFVGNISVELDKMVAARIYFDFHLSLSVMFCSFGYPYLYLTELCSSTFQTDSATSVDRYYIQDLLQITRTVIPLFTSFIGTSETAGKVKDSVMKVIISRCFPYFKFGLVLKVKKFYETCQVSLNNTQNVNRV